MPDRRDPPPTAEGWYALHDLRRIDWDAWREAPDRERQRALEEAVDHLRSTLAVEDADEGASATYSILGHKADVLVLHLRPSTADLGALERRFENTDFARFTDRATSFVSVTEASGYSERARQYFEGDLDEDSGLARYIDSRLEPTVPDATHVCFYPMDKRRRPEQNWYDLPFEERAEHMDAHGEIGREYGGRVTQMITGAVGLDDWEWGVTLWGDDLTDVKDLLYEMRFDPSTSQFADFGPFYVGRRLPPDDLPALLAGDPVPTDDVETETVDAGPLPHGESGPSTGSGSAQGDTAHSDRVGSHGGGGVTGGEGDGRVAGGDADARGGAHPGSPAAGDHPHDGAVEEDLAGRLATLGLHEGDDYEPGDYGVVCYSEAEARELAAEVEDLRENFEHYDSHVRTTVRAQGGRSAVASVWDGERAAETARGFLSDLPGVVESVRGPLGEAPGSTDTRDETGGGGDVAAIREELADRDVYAGKPHGEDVYALVLYSRADTETLVDEVADLREGFDRYDTHEGTAVYGDPEGGTAAVVSLWETGEAADTASGFLSDLPDTVGWAGEGDGFATMGMFYTVEPDHREDFVEKFETVGDLLAEMDGHRETALLVNHENENDMFVASRWDSRDDAMAFFRSDAFADTVDWGRDVLADRPRHVFLA